MEKKTLLIIEDNEINRQTLIAILEEYNVLTAANGREGLDMLRKNGQCISAVLLDIQMPVMNGYEFLEIVGQD